MPNSWNQLSHKERLTLLRDKPIDELVPVYKPDGQAPDAFRLRLQHELELWDPKNAAEIKSAGNPPTKDMLLGAWRDLDRSEAFAELIDNSIDSWRRLGGPVANLNISIRYDHKTGLLSYEDNAGGVREKDLSNLVVPGYSETTPQDATIGSYKTGGKKAIFRLASAARIDTRRSVQDPGFSIQLDEEWMRDATEFPFPYTIMASQ